MTDEITILQATPETTSAVPSSQEASRAASTTELREAWGLVGDFAARDGQRAARWNARVG